MTTLRDEAERFCGHALPPLAGHNQPPVATPYEAARDRIDELFGEALLWLDGIPVGDQATADDLSNLLNMIREAKKTADEARRVENEPFDAGKAEVQARYNPILKKAEQARETIVTALTPWLVKVAQQKTAAADVTRQEADEKKRIAEEAIRSSAGNLAERAEAEQKLTAAKKADAFAGRVAKETAKSGTVGKSVGLRHTKKPVLVDATLAARTYWASDREEMETFLLVLAARDVARGKTEIAGFEIQTVSTAV